MAKILIAGDFAPRARIAKLISEESYAEIFDEVIPFTSNVDYSILNLEAPIVASSFAKPIDKCGPTLKCSPRTIDAIKYAGFDLVTLANNHFLDYGEVGVQDTLNACKSGKIETVGGGMNINGASKILYKKIKGIKFAFINCCENEFSIATENSPGANPLNLIRQYYDIKEAKSNSDKVIVIVHGGHEHFQLPSPRMKETYRFFIDVGADVVVNHHQHCYSGYEEYKGSPIFYGLGNFCFDITPTKIDTIWNYGYMVELDIDGDQISYRIILYNQCGQTPTIKILPAGTFAEHLYHLNQCISNDDCLKKEINEYYKKTSLYEHMLIEPYSGRVLNKLYALGILPSFFHKKKGLSLFNHISCESHRDKLIYALQKKFK